LGSNLKTPWQFPRRSKYNASGRPTWSAHSERSDPRLARSAYGPEPTSIRMVNAAAAPPNRTSVTSRNIRWEAKVSRADKAEIHRPIQDSEPTVLAEDGGQDPSDRSKTDRPSLPSKAQEECI
jgi:hypothetical protein